MQVFGLPGHNIRNAGRASRLLGAKTPTIEAERRRDAVARWRRAMRDGLDAGQAARAVGVPRSTLYRWESAPEPKSRRPHRVRANGWSPTLRAELERLRQDFPFWGKDKLGPVLRKAGFAVSNATVGRILKKLVERGRVTPVPELIRKAGRKSPPKIRPHAIRKPKDVCFEKPGDVIQIDTLTLTIAPGRTVKHFDAYDVFAKWTVAKPYAQATAANAADFLAKVTAEMPWPIKAIQIDGGSEFMPNSKPRARTTKSPSMSCRHGRQNSTEPSNGATAPGATNSTLPSICQPRSTRSPSMSMLSSISTTITGHTEHSTASLQSSISKSAETG
ncbi:hypothetical protein NKI26_31625 [Mesorhizobium australicum]